MKIEDINWENHPYDFVDFGCKGGGSMDYAMKKLGGKRGLGIDIRPDVVREAREKGFDVAIGDAVKLDIPSKAVHFSVLSHFLEHLPALGDVECAIKNAVRISTDFIYIRGPVFDDEEYLKNLGLKTFWSDWTGHPCHLTTKQLSKILDSLGIGKYEINFRVKIEDSGSPNIHPINSPSDQHEYDSNIHPPKKFIKFDHNIFREFECRAEI